MEGDDYLDEDTRAAIAISLGTPIKQESGGEVVDLTYDSDDDKPREVNPVQDDEVEDDGGDDLLKAIELSLENHSESSPVAPKEVSKVAPTPKEESNPGLASMRYGIPGLDRKKQEEERLARIRNGKRKATSISPPPKTREPKAAKPAPSGTVFRHKPVDPPPSPKPASSAFIFKHKPMDPPPSPETLELRNNSQPERNGKESDSPLASSKPKPALQFPTGAVKKTWAYGYPRANDIKIEEVLQQSDLKLAVLSSFQWDMDWLFSKIDMSKSRCMLVMQAKDDATKLQYESETKSMEKLRLCFPPMEGQVNCMHSKLMLLFHPDRLRIAVPSANLVPYDWGESGVMENTVFLIDLPKKLETEKDENSTNFYDDLVYFLRASTLNEAIINKMSDFDFSQTANIGFVHTIGGSHSGVSLGRTGFCGLGKTVKAMGMATDQPLKIDFVTSSVGSLTDDFLRAMYLASQGDDGLTELSIRNSKSLPAKRIDDPSVSIPKKPGAEWKDRFRVYFPSKKTVQNSRGGPGAAGTICFQSKWYDGPKFPKNVMRDCISRRPRILMHNKMLLARSEEKFTLPDGSNCTAWAYIGSANLSESAWGRLVIDRKAKKPKLNCRNWECGVLLPIHKVDKSYGDEGRRLDAGYPSSYPESGDKASPEDTSDDIDIAKIFGGTIPVPMEVPGPSFGPQDRPWFYSEY